jgi:hypothetical protein
MEREKLYCKKMTEMKNEMKVEIKKVLGKEESEDNQYKHLKSFQEFKNFIEMLKQKKKTSDQP